MPPSIRQLPKGVLLSRQPEARPTGPGPLPRLRRRSVTLPCGSRRFQVLLCAIVFLSWKPSSKERGLKLSASVLTPPWRRARRLGRPGLGDLRKRTISAHRPAAGSGRTAFQETLTPSSSHHLHPIMTLTLDRSQMVYPSEQKRRSSKPWKLDSPASRVVLAKL